MSGDKMHFIAGENVNSGEKMYAVTLGDMTWDLYWYSNKYELADYLKTVNEAAPPGLNT